MQNDVEIIDPNSIEWSQSKIAPSGCWGKMIYLYGEDRLGNAGYSGPYTTLYKFESDSFYKPIRIVGQAIEIFVLSGALLIDDIEVTAGHWAKVPPSNNFVVFGSVCGAEIIAIVRDRVELVETTNLEETK